MTASNARGYDLLTFDDVRTGQADVRRLPFDLLRTSRQLSLTQHDLCCQLGYPVV